MKCITSWSVSWIIDIVRRNDISQVRATFVSGSHWIIKQFSQKDKKNTQNKPGEEFLVGYFVVKDISLRRREGNLRENQEYPHSWYNLSKVLESVDALPIVHLRCMLYVLCLQNDNIFKMNKYVIIKYLEITKNWDETKRKSQNNTEKALNNW